MIDHVPGARAAERRSSLRLVEDQLAAMDAFHRLRRRTELLEGSSVLSRENRLDAARRTQVMRREHEALVGWADEQLRHSVQPLSALAPRRAVLAHAHAWFASKMTTALSDGGVQVVAAVANGADAVGVAVAEQVDLLLLGEPLAMLRVEEALELLAALAPRTAVAVQVPHPERVPVLLAAGVASVFTRQVPPGDAAAELLALLARGTPTTQP